MFRTSGWLSDLVTIARAEALLASGEPQRALALVTPLPARAVVEASVVAASARRGIGDVRGAEAVLAKAVPGLESAPLPWQIQAWLLESRLAEDRGKHDRARLVLDRALRLASAEQMRRPLVHDWRWLRAFVDRDPALLRSHRDFLSTCHFEEARRRGDATPAWLRTSCLGAPLTEREGQVLDLLAQMYSTDEIAAALYVSSNTVKTHLKGIFGKLCVNRRVEAVRAAGSSALLASPTTSAGLRKSGRRLLRCLCGRGGSLHPAHPLDADPAVGARPQETVRSAWAAVSRTSVCSGTV